MRSQKNFTLLLAICCCMTFGWAQDCPQGNIVQNGDFELGVPTTAPEDITNATGWGGIWSNAGTTFSSADFYSDVTGVPPAALNAPLPASQGQFAGFWCRIQGGNDFREGVLNELNSTIMPNSGIYELTIKVACLFTPNTPASMSIFVANGGINGGAALIDGITPLNTALFTESWEFGMLPISTDCNNNFQTYTFLLDSSDPSFPPSGANALFFTRTDGIQPGAFLAIDDVCLQLIDDNANCDVTLDPVYNGGAVDGNCCWTLTYDNPGTLDLTYLSLSLQNNDGVLVYDGTIPPPGTQFFTNSSTQVSFSPAAGTAALPTGNIPGFFDFCITGMQNIPQLVAVDWYDANLQLVCTDTLFFDCQPEEFECLYVIEQTDPECDSTGVYSMDITMKNPLGNDGFTVELIKFTPPAGATYTVSPASYYPIGGVPPGGITSTDITITGAMPGDTVCFLISAHDSLEIICCAEQEICVVLPDCPPCEQVDAALCPISGGGGAACCSDDPLSLPWVQDVIADCANAPCGWEVSCCTFDDEPIIVIGPSLPCPDFPTTFYDCAGTVLAQSGGIAGGDGLPVTDCEIIYECVDGQESLPDGCCYELKLENNYADDYFTAVEVKIQTPGVSFSAINFDFGNGWIYTNVVTGSHLRWTYIGSSTIPLGNVSLMDFCLDDLDGPAVLDVCWMVGDSIACRESFDIDCDDTPTDCAEVVNEDIICNPDGSYTYSFSVLNLSGLDVHEISIIDTISGFGNIGNVIFTTPVPDGSIASGSITFTLPGTPPDSLCFLIVMRHQLENGVSIICCNIEHCIELPPCDVLCPDCEDFNDYEMAVGAGFSVNFDCPNGIFEPVALSPCDIVEWTIIWPLDLFDPDMASTIGNEPLVYQFPFEGVYTVCMQVRRFDEAGNECFNPLPPICVDVIVDCPDLQCIDPNQPTGDPCTTIFDPVCGCDGIEYPNACEAFEAGVVQWIDGPCGFNQNEEVKERLHIQPIPATNFINVQLPGTGKYNVVISSPERGMMSSQIIQANEAIIQLQIADLPLGVYWITATDRSSGLPVTGRFVKADWRK